MDISRYKMKPSSERAQMVLSYEEAKSALGHCDRKEWGECHS